MVEREMFSKRLGALTDYIARLKAFREETEERFLALPDVHHLAERYLHLASEAMLDLANHWIAEQGLKAPESNRETFTALEKAGEIPPDLAERLRGWAGFRNVLVHEYVEINHKISHGAIRDDLGDLETFARWALSKLAA